MLTVCIKYFLGGNLLCKIIILSCIVVTLVAILLELPGSYKSFYIVV